MERFLYIWMSQRWEVGVYRCECGRGIGVYN
jgi:hypothetical protein